MKDLQVRKIGVLGGCQDNAFSSLQRKRQVSYQFRPFYSTPNQHVLSYKPYCDILGRKYCVACSEETMKEAAFVRSLTEAENFIARSAMQSRMSYTKTNLVQSEYSVGKDLEPSFQEEDRIDHLVNSIFPLMYNALESRSANIKSNELQIEDERPHSRKSEDLRPNTPSEMSSKSFDTIDSVENREGSVGNRDDLEGFAEPALDQVCSNDDSSLLDMRDIRKNKDAMYSTDLADTLDEMSLKAETELSRQTPGRSIQKLVRRSSVIGKHVRNQSNEKIRSRIQTWKPAMTEEYMRGRKHRHRIQLHNDLKQVEETTTERVTPISTLDKLKQPKVIDSLPPMEPVVCGIKYIRNRWRDEAMYKNNRFAIRLNAK